MHEPTEFSESDVEIWRDVRSGTDHIAIHGDTTEMTLCGIPLPSLVMVPPPKQAGILCGECDFEMQRIEAGDIHDPEVN